MSTHSNTPAWRIPWTEEPGRPQSIVSHRVGHDWSDLAHMHTHSSLCYFIYFLAQIISVLVFGSSFSWLLDVSLSVCITLNVSCFLQNSYIILNYVLIFVPFQPLPLSFLAITLGPWELWPSLSCSSLHLQCLEECLLLLLLLSRFSRVRLCATL